MKLENELAGYLIVSLEQAVAAPYCSLLLASAGARVIKVERPEGDFARGYDAGAEGESTIFAWLNRGKESVCLNLKHAPDQDLLRQTLKRADVLLSNLAPGAVERLGLSGPELRKENPGLISCKISGYGNSGDASKKKAYDFLVQAESGVCSVTGTEDAPARVGISLTDISTGLTAFSAILRAIIQRSKTSVGVDISVSMFDVMADWMNMPLLGHRYMGRAPGRLGLKHSFIAPYGAFECGDGKIILLSVQNNREFASFCELVLGQSELSKDKKFSENTARYSNRRELDDIVTRRFSDFAAAEVVAILDKAGIANARLNSVAELSAHPLLRNETAIIGNTEIEVASLPIEGFGGQAQTVPGLGQHTEFVREEFSRIDQTPEVRT